MLSNRMTFSLTSLIVLIALGLACFVPLALANDGDEAHVNAAGTKGKSKTEAHVDADFTVTLTAAESMIDISYRGDDDANNIQIDSTTNDVHLLAEFAKVVHLSEPAVNPDDTQEDLVERAAAFENTDVLVDAYDAQGRALGLVPYVVDPTADPVVKIITLFHRDPSNPGKEFRIHINMANLKQAYSADRGGGETLDVGTLIISIPPQSVQDASLAEVRRQRLGEHEPHWNKVSNVFQIDFVGTDDGYAKYEQDLAGVTDTTVILTGEGALAVSPAAGIPGVVSIDRVLERSPIVTGPFDVRIILTEEPRMGTTSGLTADMIQVDGGSATVIGGSTVDELTLAMVGRYYIPNVSGDTPPSTAPMLSTADTDLPEATGRDDKYYIYSATITPDLGLANEDVTISIKQFMDHVKPVSNQYIPLPAHQRVAITLPDVREAHRNARLMNETLTVRASVAGDANLAAATAAYDARQKVLDAVANAKVLDNKLYIPKDGYLVLVADKGKAGIADPKVKTAEKLTAAQKLYNVTSLGLPLGAADLDSFFRNGGTLTLGYGDIPEATGSEHGDSKGPTGGDATGYTAADSTAYAAGALVFNEIMWGLDGNSTDSQYIELYNTTGKAIGIDNKEWVITVGALPDGYKAIDTVNNNPSSGYWEPPGQGGLTEGVRTAQDQEGKTTAIAVVAVKDLISMSRVMSADGTPAADGKSAKSWADSKRPGTENITGRRIGTPGAKNVYVKAPTPPPAPEPPPPAKVPAATASDLRITEIMVASSDGRLPQWIEITNVSTGDVSLDGWVVGIDNDSADADVSSALSIKLDGVTLKGPRTDPGTNDKRGQTVLVVSKTSNRNSGVAERSKGDSNKHAFDSNRIVDASEQIKPASMTYSMLSEMAFRIALEPPLPLAGGVTVRGDVVGNLGGGWKLPMSEVDRSSMIRREIGDTSNDFAGTDAAGWLLASDTMMDDAYLATYYGDKDDVGTPGYDAGGVLPVELSKFGAKRDPLTGQVIVSWETQSELNNAGFYIKRSQQKNAKFVAVNPTMIPGAGTTSEKQAYTYTDTTAQPNIVYYYQIEDVSLDGQRQTLTRAHRLKGHVGAAGKLTTLWGELKDQE